MASSCCVELKSSSPIPGRSSSKRVSWPSLAMGVWLSRTTPASVWAASRFRVSCREYAWGCAGPSMPLIKLSTSSLSAHLNIPALTFCATSSSNASDRIWIHRARRVFPLSSFCAQCSSRTCRHRRGTEGSKWSRACSTPKALVTRVLGTSLSSGCV
ncbi:hypothetical protein D3C85_1462120 [compost metagenome]